jgi:YHS domain-containing protein
MKNKKWMAVITALVVFVAGAVAVRADDTANAKPKPYPLKTCLVCGMTLGDMGKPYVFVYKGQEIKVCDKSEKADFDKNPKKYLK